MQLTAADGRVNWQNPLTVRERYAHLSAEKERMRVSLANLGLAPHNSRDTVAANKRILQEYLRFLQERHITPIIIGLPVDKRYWQTLPKKILDEFYITMEEISREKSFHFLDYFTYPLAATDFSAPDRLNDSGASKLTALVNDLLAKLEANEMRVGFIMQSPKMWSNMAPVYEKMRRMDGIKVRGLVIPGYEGKGYGACEDYDSEHETFHERYGDEVTLATDEEGKIIDIRSYHFDYVFYQRPYEWSRPRELSCAYVSRYVKTCYIAYAYRGIPMASGTYASEQDFFRHVYFGFFESSYAKDFHLKMAAASNKYNGHCFCALGFPPLEHNLNQPSKHTNNKMSILWTPRWDISRYG